MSGIPKFKCDRLADEIMSIPTEKIHKYYDSARNRLVEIDDVAEEALIAIIYSSLASLSFYIVCRTSKDYNTCTKLSRSYLSCLHGLALSLLDHYLDLTGEIEEKLGIIDALVDDEKINLIVKKLEKDGGKR